MIDHSPSTQTLWIQIGYAAMLDSSRRRYLNAGEKEEMLISISKSLGQKAAGKIVETANTAEYHGGDSLFNLVNAVTRAAQSFNPQTQTAIESFAWTILSEKGVRN